MLKFVAGLPQQLGFYVRARGPPDHQTALTEALIGEAHGYRFGSPSEAHVSTVTTATPATPGSMPMIPGATQPKGVSGHADSSAISELQSQIKELTKMVEKLRTTASNTRSTGHSTNRSPRAQQNQQQQTHAAATSSTGYCFACSAPGHNQRACNLQEGTTARLDLTCSICGQQGHGSRRCKLYGNGSRNPQQPPQRSPNQLNSQSQAVGSGRLGDATRQ